MAPTALGQRIRAAQVQAGIKSVDELAEKPGRPDKFGAKTIGRVIRGDRKLQDHEAAWLARALGVTPDYFTADPDPAETEPQLDRIEARLDRLETLLERVFHHRSAQGNDIIARLEALEHAITGAISQNAAEEAALIVDGIEAAWKAGKLPPVPPPASKPKAAKTAPTRNQMA